VSRERAQLTEERIKRAIALMKRVDRLVETTAPGELERRLLPLRAEIEEVNSSTVCEKEELDLPVRGLPVKPIQALGLLIEDKWGDIRRRLGGNGTQRDVKEKQKA